jgi:hypothetical protein
MIIDSQTIASSVQEASIYFRDNDMENPQRRRLFPSVSKSAVVYKKQHKRSAPIQFLEIIVSLQASPCANNKNNNFAGLSPVSSTIDLHLPSPGGASHFHNDEKEQRGRDFWDDISCGSLDYSLEDTEDETQSRDSPDVTAEQASIEWDLPRHHPDDHTNCFKLPFQFIVSFFHAHLGLAKTTPGFELR